MSYKKSSARKDFDEVIKFLLKQSRFSSVKNNNVPHDIQQCVYKTAIFQASAVLEEYVKTLLEDWIYSLKKEDRTIQQTPNELVCLARINRQINSYKKYIADGDEWKIIKTLKNDSVVGSYYAQDTKASEVLKSTAVIGELKYPSEKNLMKLFRRFGVENIFNAVAEKGKKDYKRLLRSFSDIRTEIAHTHPSKELTFSDIEKNLNKLSDFVVMIDRVMCSHIVKISGSECWE